MLKVKITSVFIFLLAFSMNAQVAVFSVKKDIQEIKRMKTVFVCRDTDDAEELEKLFKEVWTINDISVVPYKSMGRKNLKNKLVISLAGYVSIRGKTTNGWVYLDFAKDKRPYARLDMHITYKDFKKILEIGDKAGEAIDYMYT